MNKIAIIGGGASGLTAAISAAVSGADVTIFERLDRVGKKLLSTGNGRCNLTNCAADTTYYYGNKRFIQGVLSQFSVNETLNFFTELGLIT
ncbi:MAG: NAD(P)/FAD-dependent oxidoreductase, partial [Oscillospiraceae bacterium]